MIILKLNGKAIWLLDTLNQDSIEKKLARMYSTAYEQLGILLSLSKIARAHFLNLIFFFFEQ